LRHLPSINWRRFWYPRSNIPVRAERQRSLRPAARNNAMALGGPVEVHGGPRAAALQRAMAFDTAGTKIS
jgi:hypothetical protein